MEPFNFLLYEPDPSIVENLDTVYSGMENIEPVYYSPDICHLKTFDTSLGRYVVLLNGLCMNHGFIDEKIYHDRYVICAHRGTDVMPWEYVYHLDGNTMNDNIENLFVVDTNSKPIEVKHPYDAEKYRATLIWDKSYKVHKVRLMLKKEYKYDDSLKNEIQTYLNKYIVETEIKNRFLDKDETVIFIDKNKINYDLNNLKVIRENELKEDERYPIEYYTCTKQLNYKGDRYIAHLYVKGNIDQSRTGMSYARWVMACHLGRWLTNDEEVHHKDNDTLNDNIKNLELLTVDRHKQITSHEIDQLVPKLNLTCFNCSDKFLKHVSDYVLKLGGQYRGKHKQYYCSRDCYVEHKRNYYKTINIKMRSVKCINCQKEFEIPLNSEYIITHPLLENQIFCCKKCASQYVKRYF